MDVLLECEFLEVFICTTDYLHGFRTNKMYHIHYIIDVHHNNYYYV